MDTNVNKIYVLKENCLWLLNSVMKCEKAFSEYI